MLDPRRLQVLKAVVDSGSITRAATTLGYSASAVSQSVAALEREAKIPLFEKIGRGIRPTQAGLLLAEHAAGVADRLRDAEEALEALRAGQAGRLRIAAFATAGAALVPRALARFKETHPGVDLDLVIEETDAALASVRSGQTDVAVIAEHSPSSDAGSADLAYVHLLDDPYRIVLARSHALAGKHVIALEALRDEPWIATESARCNCLETVTTACGAAGFTPHFAIEADEFATTVGFVSAGLGVAMVPMLALSAIPDSARVLRLANEGPSRYVYAVTRDASSSHPMTSAMVEALRSSAGSYLRAA